MFNALLVPAREGMAARWPLKFRRANHDLNRNSGLFKNLVNSTTGTIPYHTVPYNISSIISRVVFQAYIQANEDLLLPQRKTKSSYSTYWILY